MLAVVKQSNSPGVSVKQLPVPQPQPSEVLVKIRLASICGTDVSIYNWTPWAKQHITPPTVIGHEIVGEIIEINGDPNDLKLGDLVSSETHIFCDHCSQCQIGNRHICENLQLFGIGRDGGFAEYATIPIKTTWKNHPSLPVEVMSVQEPLGNAVAAASKVTVTGKAILVMGLGPVGLCEVAVCKAQSAAKVIGINPTELRRELALKMGADEVYETLPDNLLNHFDIVFEVSGNEHGIQDSLKAVKISGTIVLVGIPNKEVSIDIGKYFINKELTVKSLFGRKIWDSWHQAEELLVSKQVDLSPMITHKFKLSEFEKAIDVMKSENCGKILLTL